MVDWFRNTKWNDEIEAGFDARLGRARDKAQYLNIQAYTLLPSNPRIAAKLCRRVLALNDSSNSARAGLYLGTALAMDGDLEGAISALQEAIEAERFNPTFRTAAYLDLALLVAWMRRSELYDIVSGLLDERHAEPFEDQLLSVLIARALIDSERGADVSRIAAIALNSLDTDGANDGSLPDYLRIDDIKLRLRKTAEQ